MFAPDPASSNVVQGALSLSAALMAQGRPSEAGWALQEALLKAPANADLLSAMADLRVGQSQFVEASGFLRRLCLALPGDVTSRCRLVDCLMEAGRFREALRECDQAGPDPDGIPEIFNRKLRLLAELGDIEERLALIERGLANWPGHPSLIKDRADALVAAGRSHEAERELRLLLAEHPTFGEAWFTLSNIKSVTLTEEDTAAMRQALGKRLSLDDEKMIRFALGKAYEDAGRTDASFQQYHRANRIHARPLGALLGDIAEFVPAMMTLLDARPGKGHDASDPIFVCGLHRAGSTLVEQILSSHPLIEGTRELGTIPQLFRSVRDRAGSDALAIRLLAEDQGELCSDLGRQYIDLTSTFRETDRPYFVDKQPANWLFVPFIRRILPNARIIDARRHPMACGFSLFRQYFPAGVFYSYDLEAIGQYYRYYLAMMERADLRAPNEVHHLLNERLIDDPEGQIRRLFEFLDLPFDPVVLQFHRNRRAVHTPSAEQVRQPVNASGRDRWQDFAPHLAPLRKSLGDALERWNRG